MASNKRQVVFTKAQLDALMWLMKAVPLKDKPAHPHPLYVAQNKIKTAVRSFHEAEAVPTVKKKAIRECDVCFHYHAPTDECLSAECNDRAAPKSIGIAACPFMVVRGVGRE